MLLYIQVDWRKKLCASHLDPAIKIKSSAPIHGSLHYTEGNMLIIAAVWFSKNSENKSYTVI